MAILLAKTIDYIIGYIGYIILTFFSLVWEFLYIMKLDSTVGNTVSQATYPGLIPSTHISARE